MLKYFCFGLSIMVGAGMGYCSCTAGQRAFIQTAEDGYTVTTGCLKFYGEEKGWLMEGVVRTQTDAQQILTTLTNGSIFGSIQTTGTIDGSFSGAFRGINLILFQAGSLGGKLNGNINLSSTAGLEINLKSVTTPTYTKGLIIEANYREGQLDGVTRTYKTNIYRQKTLFEERNYKKDQLNGNYVGYNDMQIPETTGYFVNGQKTGEWKFYDKNGVVQTRGSYLNDKKNGTWTSSNPMEFPVFETSDDVKSRMKSFELEFVDEMNGRFVAYGNNHYKLVEGRYISGKMDGAWTFYGDNEVPELQCAYAEGKKIDQTWKKFINGEAYDIAKIVSKTTVKIRMRQFSVPYNGRYWWNADATIHMKDLNASTSVSGKETISIDENDYYEPDENQSPWVYLKVVDGTASFETSITSNGITPLKQNLTYRLAGAFDDKGNIVINTVSNDINELTDDKTAHPKGYLCQQAGYSNVAIGFRKYEASSKGRLTWTKFYCAPYAEDNLYQYANFEIKIEPPKNIQVPIFVGLEKAATDFFVRPSPPQPSSSGVYRGPFP